MIELLLTASLFALSPDVPATTLRLGGNPDVNRIVESIDRLNRPTGYEMRQHTLELIRGIDTTPSRVYNPVLVPSGTPLLRLGE
jgi:hypothetical protein